MTSESCQIGTPSLTYECTVHVQVLWDWGGGEHSHTEHGKTLFSKPNQKTLNMKTGKELA